MFIELRIPFNHNFTMCLVTWSRLTLTLCDSMDWRLLGSSLHGILQEEYWNEWPFPLLLLFGCLVVSDSLWPHGLQHSRSPCPSPFPRVCSNSCPLSRWCHPTISSSVVPFSFSPQSFQSSVSFPMNGLFASAGQSIGASASVLALNVHNWFPLKDPTNLVCLLINCASKREWSLFLCVWLHWLHYICKI